MQGNNLGQLTQELMAAVVAVGTEDVEEVIRAAGWKSTGATILVASVWKKAVGGDVNAAKLLREMNGEADHESGTVDFSQMSDAMLRKMAEGEALMAVAEDKGCRTKDSSGDADTGCRIKDRSECGDRKDPALVDKKEPEKAKARYTVPW